MFYLIFTYVWHGFRRKWTKNEQQDRIQKPFDSAIHLSGKCPPIGIAQKPAEGEGSKLTKRLGTKEDDIVGKLYDPRTEVRRSLANRTSSKLDEA